VDHLFATALSASDRAALQSLIPLASGLGAGTIFGLFFVGRRRASFAVFESIAIVAVLVSVATTAYYAIYLLHRDTAITNRELVETSVPLVIAAVLLILISIVARLRGATERISALLPLVLVAVVATVEVAGSGIPIEPGFAPVAALAILAVGAGFGGLGAAIDARARRTMRAREHDHVATLTGRGYALAEAPLAAALPRLPEDAAPPTIDVWRREGASFLDAAGAAHLRDVVDERWQSLADGEGRGPIGPATLLAVVLTGAMGGKGRPRGAAGPASGAAGSELGVTTLRAGPGQARRTATVRANADGLFDVTDLLA
jgi:hypothetical protein